MKETIVNNVYVLRTAMNTTQEEVALAVDVSRQTIIAIERGNYVPSVLLSLKLATFFKKPVEDIFQIRHVK